MQNSCDGTETWCFLFLSGGTQNRTGTAGARYVPSPPGQQNPPVKETSPQNSRNCLHREQAGELEQCSVRKAPKWCGEISGSALGPVSVTNVPVIQASQEQLQGVATPTFNFRMQGKRNGARTISIAGYCIVYTGEQEQEQAEASLCRNSG